MTEIEEIPKTLEELLPADMFVGTSLILREGKAAESNRFLYGIRPVKELGRRLILEITGIGGGMEAEDSSPGAGAIREAQEEIACEVTLIPSSMTLLVKGYQDMSLINVAGPEKPLAIIYRHYKSPPHSPWHPYNSGVACQVLFMGKLNGRPRPNSELPNLIWLPSGLVLETARRDVPLGELLMAGAALVPGESGAPALDGLARMTDSQEAFALALGSEAPAIYDALFHGDLSEQLSILLAANNKEREYQEPAEYSVADPAELSLEDIVQSGGDQEPAADSATASQDATALEELLSANRSLLELLRGEINEATAKIDRLIARTEKMEGELHLLRKSQSGSRNRISRLWSRRTRRRDE